VAEISFLGTDAGCCEDVSEPAIVSGVQRMICALLKRHENSQKYGNVRIVYKRMFSHVKEREEG
jgi:hypothetical protein